MKALSLLLAVSLAACGSRGPTDQVADGGAPGGDGSSASSCCWSFEAETAGGPSVGLDLASIDGDRATIRVVARGVASLQGVAFRLRYDPTQLAVERALPGKAWGLSSVKSVSRFTAHRKQGELWAGVGHLGRGGLPASAEVELATVQVRLLVSGGKVPVRFAPFHGLVMDPDGRTVKVTWRNGLLKKVKL